MESLNICDLPDEILIKIMQYVSTNDRKILRLVNKTFSYLVDHCRLLNTCTFYIHQANIEELERRIRDNTTHNLNLSDVCIQIPKSIDLEYIMQSIGERITTLHMDLHCNYKGLKTNVPNLKCLKLKLSDTGTMDLDLKSLVNLTHLDLRNLTHHPWENTKKMLYNIIEASSVIHLKSLMLNSCSQTEKEVFMLLELQVNTLETFEVHFSDKTSIPHARWEQLLSRFHGIKNLLITGNCAEHFIDCFFKSLPATCNLECFETSLLLKDRMLIYIANKWSNTLKRLNIMFNGVLTNTAFKHLSKLTSLTSFKVSFSKINQDGIIKGLASKSNPNFRKLVFMCTDSLKPMDVKILATRFNNLTVLCLSACDEAVTNESLSYIFKYCTKLKTLGLDENTRYSDEGLMGYGATPYSIKRLRGLRTLRLNYSRLTNLSLEHAIHFPELRVLHLSNCIRITSEGIRHLVQNCPAIEVLKINSSKRLDKDAVYNIGTKLKRLKSINLSFLDKIDARVCIRYLIDYFDSLEEVELYYPSRRNDSVPKFLKKHKPSLRKIDSIYFPEFLENSNNSILRF